MKSEISWRPFAVICQGMGAKRMPLQSCTHSETRLQNYVETANGIVCNSNNSQRLCKSTKAKVSFGLCSRNASKIRHYSGKNECNSGLLQQTVFSSKTKGKWRPVIDLSVLNMHRSQHSRWRWQRPSETPFANGNG